MKLCLCVTLLLCVVIAHVECSVADDVITLKSHARTGPEHRRPVEVRSRKRRSLTQAEKDLALDKHNTLRASEGAASMKKMVSHNRKKVHKVLIIFCYCKMSEGKNLLERKLLRIITIICLSVA